jgi:hypothetical protein
MRELAVLTLTLAPTRLPMMPMSSALRDCDCDGGEPRGPQFLRRRNCGLEIALLPGSEPIHR